jgi:hypothetical protein
LIARRDNGTHGRRKMRNGWFASFLARLRDPRSRWLRIPIGLALLFGGLFGFLPILGFWMAPLGLSLLAIDFLWAERMLRRLKGAARRLRLHVGKMRRSLSGGKAKRD